MEEEVVGTNNLPVVKGKRTKRHRPAATATTATDASSDVSCTNVVLRNTEEEEDMANCLILLAQGGRHHTRDPVRPAAAAVVYECKTCAKTFPSFQALGGHRASHKKPKLAAALKEEEARNRRSNNIVLSDDDDTIATTTATTAPTTDVRQTPAISNNNNISSSLSLQLTNRALYSSSHKQRVHECSICGAEFASGQALGGHMRRHRGPTTGNGSQTTASTAGLTLTLHVEGNEGNTNSKKVSLDLDLNLPAMPDVEEVNRSESKHVFAGKQSPAAAEEQPQQKQLVFSPALVDCHY